MCQQEFIAYQCGHRSMAVVRPCPLTTAAKNFKPCASQPYKQYNAHTISALGHPHQLHAARTSSHGSSHADPTQTVTAITARLRTNEKGKQPGRGPMHQEYPSTARASSDSDPSAFSAPESGAIPQAYVETFVDGEYHVAIRVPGLYAAEWVADHRALHASGECSCSMNLSPFRPSVDEGDIPTAERQFLDSYRNLENAGSSLTASEITARVSEITRLFGSFTPLPIEPTKSENHHLVTTAIPEVPPQPQLQPVIYAWVRTSQLMSPVDIYPDTDPRAASYSLPLIARGSSEPHSLAPYTDPVHDASRQIHQITHSEMSTTAETNTDTNLTHPSPYTNTNLAATPQAYILPYHPPLYGIPSSALWSIPPSTSQSLFQPTSATTFWPPHAQRLPSSNPPMLIGPGPYTTSGLNFHEVLNAANADDDDESRSEPAGGIGGEQEQEEEKERPLCGLPVGAGPEGESHVPKWRDCRLARGTGPAVLGRGTGLRRRVSSLSC